MEEARKEQRKRLGEKFRRVREEQGWSTEQVSLMSDLTAATVEKIEAGAFNVPLDVLVRVADVLGVELTVQEV